MRTIYENSNDIAIANVRNIKISFDIRVNNHVQRNSERKNQKIYNSWYLFLAYFFIHLHSCFF